MISLLTLATFKGGDFDLKIGFKLLSKLPCDSMLFGRRGTPIIRIYYLGFEVTNNGALILYLWNVRIVFCPYPSPIYPHGFIWVEEPLYVEDLANIEDGDD